MTTPDVETAVRSCAERARAAAGLLAGRTRADKDAALHAMAAALTRAAPTLQAANDRDVAAARAAGASEAVVDRLTLTPVRLASMADGLRSVAGLPDPVGDVVRGSRLPNGLELRQVRVPFGVVAIIYEARPNVTVDAAGLCLKSGNAVLLRGSASAHHSNAALVEVLRRAAEAAGLPADCVQLVPGLDHDSVKALLRLRGLVDVVIPRGGAGLIQAVVTESQVPVIETGVGNCHLYVDAEADLEMAVAILLDAKTSRPAVCNAVETLLVHEAIAAEFLPRALDALRDAGVTVHGDPAVAAYAEEVVPATEQDWAQEYLSLDLAAAVVPDVAGAVAHIRRWSSGHTEAVVTGSQAVARAFVAGVDSAAVLVNASTRFTDGGEFGFGAEIGISTQKLHARGPMGLPELTSTSYVLVGEGQVRGGA